MSKIAKIVGENIRLLRQQRSLSQEHLAFKAGMNTSYLGQIERGQKSPTVDSLDKIAVALDVEIDELFTSEKEITQLVELPIADKIIYELKGRTIQEQNAIYDLMKRLLHFKDMK